ncbi:unnamed protein product [Zymoseptoria tritici ST99CH_1A5]|uniref:Zn(2)-C6 fungal-type domain-containing protein n=3 Tax=Zymoseptoria tritici TaxID=1047171 RepID=A0A1X7RMB0_ZYMT9|nr:unnamed protein product [Zymoseptoria tritici ST99CH_3D7]SMY22238.1 unnamed protein product [Zymoseptoria tritici ST99CH_1A5]
MFSIIDTAAGELRRPKTMADRACDQCKSRKVRCDMTKPCLTCRERQFNCTYDKARKKRGPAGKRIHEIRQNQGRFEENNHHSQPDLVSPTSSSTHTVVPNGLESEFRHGESFSQKNENHAGRQLSSFTPEPVHWPSGTTPTPGEVNFREVTTSHNGQNYTASPSQSEMYFPSLPLDSPNSSLFDTFGSISQSELPAEAADVWPARVHEHNLLPWIDVYFKRLHPTMPILNRANMYCEMLLRKHRTDPQYGAMLLGLCAFAMTQPVQIHERGSIASRSVQARMLMEECVRMRMAPDFGEDPTIETILASFFLFACLFGSHQHKAARHKLREAVDLAYSLGMHLPQSYTGLTRELREQWLRTYLVLSVTERAYALQQSHSISFRGRPGITARFMQAFDPSATNEYISSLIYQDRADAVGMTALLYLMDTFDAIDESVMDCWNGYCRFSDGACESFDRRRALQMFRAQHRVRDACLTGTILFAPSVEPLPMAQLLESQQIDISVTQLWLLGRLWQLCLTHGMLRETSDHAELRFDFAFRIGLILMSSCNVYSLSAMEVHGVGLVEKVYDVAMGVITAMSSCSSLHLDLVILSDSDVIASPHPVIETKVRELLNGFASLMREFRGGDHKYNAQFETALAGIPGFHG